MQGHITVAYRIDASGVPESGKGFYLAEDVPAGRVLIAPTHVTRTVGLDEIFGPEPPEGADTSVMWFEDRCVISPDYPDDFFINHSFEPNAVWHLGFVFALRELRTGEELFLDYQHLIAPGRALDFADGATGRPIVGLSWKESLRITAAQVLGLAEKM